MSHKFDPNYPPRLYHGSWNVKKRWYIDFRIWDTDKQQFVRKQHTGMNKHTTLAKRKEAALKALEEITSAIKAGVVTSQAPVEPEADQPRFDLKTLTVSQAFTYFLNYKNACLEDNEEHHLVTKYNEGMARVSEGMFKAYKGLKTKVIEYLELQKKPNLLLSESSTAITRSLFDYIRKEEELENKTHNTLKGYLSTFFNFYIDDQELTIKNPTVKVEKLQEEESERHPPYTKEQWLAITKLCEERGEEQLLLFIKFMYYLFIRPRKELRLLQVKDIHLRTIFVPGTTAKNNKGQHITIPLELEQLIQKYRYCRELAGLFDEPRGRLVANENRPP